MYQIITDRDLHLMTVQWRRPFAHAEVAGYAQDFMRRFLSAGFGSGYRLLLDIAPCGAQPQDALAELLKHMTQIPKASRIAVVVVIPVARQQIRRVMTQPYMRIFDDVPGARAWIVH